jgi:hypothetical protein
LASQYLLSEACIALGEHLAQLLDFNKQQQQQQQSDKNKTTNITTLTTSRTALNDNQMGKDARAIMCRDGLNAFADATLYAAMGESYELVIHATRHYWNLCLPMLSQVNERAKLQTNLEEILHSLQIAYKYKPTSTNNKTVENNEITPDPIPALSKEVNNKKLSSISEKSQSKQTKLSEVEKKSSFDNKNDSIDIEDDKKYRFNQYEDAFDDLTLRCVLYACLFQISIDKNQYEEALDQMEDALRDLPRTDHRLLIYRFKVITKSKLGRDVQMDLQKFREESEINLAKMYRMIALSSIKHQDTISSYQRAIEALAVILLFIFYFRLFFISKAFLNF